MFRDGYIAAPPTITVFSDAAGAGLARLSMTPSASIDAPMPMDSRLLALVMGITSNSGCRSCLRQVKLRGAAQPGCGAMHFTFCCEKKRVASRQRALARRLDQFGVEGWARRTPGRRTARRLQTDAEGRP